MLSWFYHNHFGSWWRRYWYSNSLFVLIIIICLLEQHNGAVGATEQQHTTQQDLVVKECETFLLSHSKLYINDFQSYVVETQQEANKRFTLNNILLPTNAVTFTGYNDLMYLFSQYACAYSSDYSDDDESNLADNHDGNNNDHDEEFDESTTKKKGSPKKKGKHSQTKEIETFCQQLDDFEKSTPTKVKNKADEIDEIPSTLHIDLEGILSDKYKFPSKQDTPLLVLNYLIQDVCHELSTTNVVVVLPHDNNEEGTVSIQIRDETNKTTKSSGSTDTIALNHITTTPTYLIGSTSTSLTNDDAVTKESITDMTATTTFTNQRQEQQQSFENDFSYPGYDEQQQGVLYILLKFDVQASLDETSDTIQTKLSNELRRIIQQELLDIASNLSDSRDSVDSAVNTNYDSQMIMLNAKDSLNGNKNNNNNVPLQRLQTTSSTQDTTNDPFLLRPPELIHLDVNVRGPLKVFQCFQVKVALFVDLTVEIDSSLNVRYVYPSNLVESQLLAAIHQQARSSPDESFYFSSILLPPTSETDETTTTTTVFSSTHMIWIGLMIYVSLTIIFMKFVTVSYYYNTDNNNDGSRTLCFNHSQQHSNKQYRQWIVTAQ